MVMLLAALLQHTYGAAQAPVPVYEPGVYNILKQNNALPRISRIADTTKQTAAVQVLPAPATSVTCECFIPIDNSFTVVPFTNGIAPDYRNDDGSSPVIAIPFTFCFYGQTQSTCYINNNGNISFGAPYPTFSANAFPDPNFVMIAPFWGDVDTRSITSGLVYYKITPSYMVVRWQTVDFFDATNPAHTSLYNDFQLIITDGSDPILPPGNNVSFCYGDMQWTTGDASGGTGGFGGIAATVGVNRGNGVDYIQIGQFDAPGTAYDGPFGLVDQVSWLDNQTFYFDVCTNNGNNLPPIVNSAQICDTIQLCAGDTLDINATFLSPEQGQNTSISVNSNSLLGYSTITNTTGNPGVYVGQLIANMANAGFQNITITGTDNGTPPQSTTANIVLEIISSPAANFTFTPGNPVTTGTTVQFTDNTPGAIQWWWNFGDGDTSSAQNPAHPYNTAGTYTVTLTAAIPSGCTGTYTTVITVSDEPVFLPVLVPNIFTPGSDGANDLLVFENLLQYADNELVVFDRWGKEVYRSADYRNDWNGGQCKDGVYYFILNIPYANKSFSGFVHLIRS